MATSLTILEKSFSVFDVKFEEKLFTDRDCGMLGGLSSGSTFLVSASNECMYVIIYLAIK